MQKLETERLVRKLAVLDNRTVNDGVVDAWHELVGHLTYTVAELALRKARQDVTINWVEPKHVLAKAHDAARELNERLRDWHGRPRRTVRVRQSLSVPSTGYVLRRVWSVARLFTVSRSSCRLTGCTRGA
jgi:hypothetical protein